MSKDGLGRHRTGPDKTAILIPVRLGGSRFPDKAIQTLWGKPLFWWPYRAATASSVAHTVKVVTNSTVVAGICGDLDVDFHYLDEPHPTGSDRIAAAMLRQDSGLDDAQIIINLQCDEPQVGPNDLRALVAPMRTNKLIQVATLGCPFAVSIDRKFDPNLVKVLLDQRSHALYFTRAPVRPHRDSCLAHVGVYAYRRRALEAFYRYPQGDLEQVESLEQLRLLEEGVPIDVVRLSGTRQSVNCKEDLEWLETQSPATI